MKYTPFASGYMILAFMLAGAAMIVYGVVFEDFFLATLICVIIGIIAIVNSICLIIQNKRYKTILKNGITLEATVTDIERADPVMKNMAINAVEVIITRGMSEPSSKDNEKGYAVLCEWKNPVTGQVHKFRSKGIDAFMTPYIGRNITVYVDPNDYTKYWVDIDSLLKQPMSVKAKPFTYERKQ